MNVISLLIKPASSSCNLRCKYCFYLDIAHNRKNASFGKMSYETLETIIKEVFLQNPRAVIMAFQGGEPTIVGLEFFEETVRLVNLYNFYGVPVSYSIQTNGILINDLWCDFLKRNNFLVGISLDGPKFIHDRNRVDAHNYGTFIKVINNIELLKKHHVNFNILTVVNNELVNNLEKVYHFFRFHSFNYLQFIPCLTGIGEDQAKALSKEKYEVFLNELFSLWYTDLLKGEKVSIRYFDNLIGIILGFHPQSCDLNNQCSDNLIVESNGDLYPCDFYVLDDYRLGNIKEGLASILNNTARLEFINSSKKASNLCTKCEFYALCRGGCKKHKELNSTEHLNYFCQSYFNFFKKNISKLELLAYKIKWENKNKL